MFFFKLHYIKKLPATEGRATHVSQEHAQTKHTSKKANGKTEGENRTGRGKPRERTNVSTQGKTTDSHRLNNTYSRCALTTTPPPLKLKLLNQSKLTYYRTTVLH